MDKDDQIPLIGGDPARNPEVRGLGSGPGASISVAKLKEQIGKLTRAVSTALVDQPPAATGFGLEEIKVTAELTAGGELGFVVAGAKVETKGAIELTFRRTG